MPKHNPKLNVNFKYSKPSSFLNFHKTFSFLNFGDSEKTDPEILSIQQKVDEMISLDDYKSLFLLLENGYKFTEKQEDTLIESLSVFFHSDAVDNPYKYKDMANKLKSIEAIPELSERFYIKLGLHDNFLNSFGWTVYGSIDSFQKQYEAFATSSNPQTLLRNQVLKAIYDALQNKELLIKEWTKKLYSIIHSKELVKSEHNLARHPYNFFKSYLFEHINKNQQQDLIKSLSYIYNTCAGTVLHLFTTQILNELSSLNVERRDAERLAKNDSYIKSIIEPNSEQPPIKPEKSYNPDDIVELIQRTRHVFLGKAPPLLIEEKISFVNATNLPDSSQKILQDIENYYLKISPYKNTLSAEEKQNIERFINERIPQYVETYHSLDEEYKINSNKKEDPINLLNQSLSNILDILIETNDNINKSKISSLKAGVNYTSSYKN